MTVKERYEAAKEIYRAAGVDTDAALEALKNIPVSMHCLDLTGQAHFPAGFRRPETTRDAQEHRKS